MQVWVIVPVKAPDACKTRLAGTLPDPARRALVAAMLGHVVATAAAAEGIGEVVLVGPERHRLDPALRLLPDPGEGLDAALGGAVAVAAIAGASRAIILPADLAVLERSDVALLAGMAPREVGIASDRAGRGTNALSLPLPAGRAFAFGYGEGSFARHIAAIGRLGLAPRIVTTAGLALDIDRPDDLALLPPRYDAD